MPDVTLTPVAGDPWNGGAQDLDPATAPPLTVRLGPTRVEQNAASGDPTDYTPQAPLPGTEETLQQLGSGQAADRFADYAVSTLPHTSSPAANYAMAAGVAPVMAGLHALDAYTNAARWAGDVQAGRYGTDVTDPASQAAIVPGAVQTAMAMGAPGMGMAEENAAGIFGGRMSRTADLDMLDEAKANKALQGTQWAVDAPTTLRDTGWFRGRDGEWRYEISDHDAALKPGADAATRLGDALDHPSLFAAYPSLRDAPLNVMPPQARAGGAFSPVTGIAVNGGLSDPEKLGVLLHETQHAIQHAEGFGVGSSPGALHSGYDGYRRTAGEVEARNVQARQALTPEQRAADGSLPWETMDVPAADQLTAPRKIGAPYSKPPVGHPEMGMSLSMPPGDATPLSKGTNFAKVGPNVVERNSNGYGDVDYTTYRAKDYRRGDKSDPLASMALKQHADGRYEVDQVQVDPQYRRQGLATSLYQHVQDNLGTTMQPSGQLLPDGYAFWQNRDPAAVQYHRQVDGPNGTFYSPKQLQAMTQERTFLGPEAYQAAFDALPPEAKTPEALARMFVGGIPGGLALAGQASTTQPADPPASLLGLLLRGRGGA